MTLQVTDIERQAGAERAAMAISLRAELGREPTEDELDDALAPGPGDLEYGYLMEAREELRAEGLTPSYQMLEDRADQLYSRDVAAGMISDLDILPADTKPSDWLQRQGWRQLSTMAGMAATGHQLNLPARGLEALGGPSLTGGLAGLREYAAGRAEQAAAAPTTHPGRLGERAVDLGLFLGGLRATGLLGVPIQRTLAGMGALGGGTTPEGEFTPMGAATGGAYGYVTGKMFQLGHRLPIYPRIAAYSEGLRGLARLEGASPAEQETAAIEGLLFGVAGGRRGAPEIERLAGMAEGRLRTYAREMGLSEREFREVMGGPVAERGSLSRQAEADLQAKLEQKAGVSWDKMPGPTSPRGLRGGPPVADEPARGNRLGEIRTWESPPEGETISPIPTPQDAGRRARRAQRAKYEGGAVRPKNRESFEVTLKNGKKAQLLPAQLDTDAWTKLMLDRVPDPHEAAEWFQRMAGTEESPGVMPSLNTRPDQTYQSKLIEAAVTQQRDSPSAGMAKVLSDVEAEGGAPVPAVGRLASVAQNMRLAREGRYEEIGWGEASMKLYDFIDALLGKTTRSVMNDDGRLGSPVPIDTHAHRTAYIDKKWKEILLKNVSDADRPKVEALEIDSAGMTVDQYETHADYYHQRAAELNNREFLGRQWEPREVIALEWAFQTSQTPPVRGDQPRDLMSRYRKTAAVEIEVEPGVIEAMPTSDAPWDWGNNAEMYVNLARWHPDIASRVTGDVLANQARWITRTLGLPEDAVRVAGVKLGLHNHRQRPSGTVEITATPEVQSMAVELLQALNHQEGVITWAANTRGARSGIVLSGESLRDPQRAHAVFIALDKLVQRRGLPPLPGGYSASSMGRDVPALTSLFLGRAQRVVPPEESRTGRPEWTDGDKISWEDWAVEGRRTASEVAEAKWLRGITEGDYLKKLDDAVDEIAYSMDLGEDFHVSFEQFDGRYYEDPNPARAQGPSERLHQSGHRGVVDSLSRYFPQSEAYLTDQLNRAGTQAARRDIERLTAEADLLPAILFKDTGHVEVGKNSVDIHPNIAERFGITYREVVTQSRKFEAGFVDKTRRPESFLNRREAADFVAKKLEDHPEWGKLRGGILGKRHMLESTDYLRIVQALARAEGKLIGDPDFWPSPTGDVAKTRIGQRRSDQPADVTSPHIGYGEGHTPGIDRPVKTTGERGSWSRETVKEIQLRLRQKATGSERPTMEITTIEGGEEIAKYVGEDLIAHLNQKIHDRIDSGEDLDTIIADHLRLSKITAHPEAALGQDIAMVEAIADLQRGYTERQRRGIVPWAQTNAEAAKRIAGVEGVEHVQRWMNRLPGDVAESPGDLVAMSAFTEGMKNRLHEQMHDVKMGNNSSAAVGELIGSVQRLAIMVSHLQGAKSEAGRMLNILKQMSQQLEGTEEIVDLAQIVTRETDPQVIIRVIEDALQADKEGRGADSIRMLQAAVSPRAWDKFIELMQAGAVTSPWTHFRNTVGNTGPLMWNVAERAMAGAAGGITRPKELVRGVQQEVIQLQDQLRVVNRAIAETSDQIRSVSHQDRPPDRALQLVHQTTTEARLKDLYESRRALQNDSLRLLDEVRAKEASIERVYPTEAVELAVGYMEGFYELLRGMSRYALDPQAPEAALMKRFGRGAMSQESKMEASRRVSSLQGPLRHYTQSVFWLLNAEDVFFKLLHEQAQMRAIARREGIRDGLTGMELARHVHNTAREGRWSGVEGEPNALLKEAKQYGAKHTFTEQLGPTGQAFMSWTDRARIPILIFLFRKTPINVNKWALERTPGLQLLFPSMRADLLGRNGGVRADMAWGRVGMGLAMTGATLMALEEGMLTGTDEYDSPGIRDAKRTANINPYSAQSMNEDGTMDYSEYRHFDPLSQIIGTTADAHTLWRKGQLTERDWLDIMTYSVLAFGQSMQKQSMIRGASSMFLAMKEPLRYGGSWRDSLLTLPIPAAINWAATQYDPYMMRARGTLQKAQKKAGFSAQFLSEADLLSEKQRVVRLPFSLEIPALTPMQDFWGMPVEQERGWIDPRAKGTAEPDPILSEIIRLNVNIPKPKKRLSWFKPPLDLPDWDYFEMLQASRQLAKEELGWEVLTQDGKKVSEGWKSLTYTEKDKILRDTIGRRWNEALDVWVEDAVWDKKITWEQYDVLTDPIAREEYINQRMKELGRQ